MPIFDFLGEVAGQFIIEVVVSAPVKIYEWVTGKQIETGDSYRTEHKKFIKFSSAEKMLVIWETDVDDLKSKMTDGLRTINENSDVTAFLCRTIGERTIIQAPASLSFYSFHFLVQWLNEHKTKTIGLVETARTAYTTYNEPDSENLIGQTDKGKKFFISLMEDYSKRQFLRINRNVRTIADYDVANIKSDLSALSSSTTPAATAKLPPSRFN